MGTPDMDGAVSNNLEQYENLCFLLYGAEGTGVFRDELGNDMTLTWNREEETIGGRLSCPVTVFRLDGRDHGATDGSLFGRAVRGVRKEKL